jgi:hypothetical protein
MKAKDPKMTKDILLHEIADAITSRRDDVIDKLNYAGLHTDSSITTKELTDKVIENLSNKRFSKGMSEIIAKNHRDEYEGFSSSDGKSSDTNDVVSTEISNMSTKDTTDLHNRIATMDSSAPATTKSGVSGGWITLGWLALITVVIIGVVKTENKK